MRFATWSRGVVRASRIIRSEYSARLVQIFLAVDDVAIALAPGEGLERGGIRARTRLRHAEGLEPQLAARHIWGR